MGQNVRDLGSGEIQMILGIVWGGVRVVLRLRVYVSVLESGGLRSRDLNGVLGTVIGKSLTVGRNCNGLLAVGCTSI